ncbi:MAG: DUF2680 domain-containing protein [Candidatus Aquicultorales bacterium]
MNRKTKALVAVMLAGAAMIALWGSAFAAAPDSPAGQTAGTVGRWCGSALDAVAGLLGISRDDVVAERQAGKSLANIAEEKGVGKDAVVGKILETRKAVLDERVESGSITREQADEALARMEERITSRVENSAVGPGCGGTAGGGGGAGFGGGGGCGAGGGGARFGGGQNF